MLHNIPLMLTKLKPTRQRNNANWQQMSILVHIVFSPLFFCCCCVSVEFFFALNEEEKKFTCICTRVRRRRSWWRWSWKFCWMKITCDKNFLFLNPSLLTLSKKVEKTTYFFYTQPHYFKNGRCEAGPYIFTLYIFCSSSSLNWMTQRNIGPCIMLCFYKRKILSFENILLISLSFPRRHSFKYSSYFAHSLSSLTET